MIKSTPAIKKLVTIKTAANLLGLSPSTLRHWDKKGKLRPIRNASQYRLYKITDLLKLIRSDDKAGGLRPKRLLLG